MINNKYDKADPCHYIYWCIQVEILRLTSLLRSEQIHNKYNKNI